MDRRRNWPLIGFFVVAAAFPLAAFVDQFVFSRCSATILAEIAKDKPDFGCGEFFFNRYQTSLAALMAAAVALFVVRPVFKQLRAMNIQSAFGARQVLEEISRLIDEEIESVRAIDEQFFFIEAHFMDFDGEASDGISQRDAEAALQLLESLPEFAAKIRQSDRRQLESSQVGASRREFLAAYDEHRRACRNLSGRVVTLRRRQEAGETLMPIDILATRLGRAEETRKMFEVCRRDLAHRLEQISRRKWARVNELLLRAEAA